eukprot:9476398-Pyramimonas_sp.AAC.1
MADMRSEWSDLDDLTWGQQRQSRGRRRSRTLCRPRCKMADSKSTTAHAMAAEVWASSRAPTA